MSSPYAGAYPPSSAPGGTPGNDSSLQSRPAIDPLAFDDVHGLGGSRGTANGRGPRTEAQTGEDITERPTRRNTGHPDPSAIPRVKDDTGDKVMESFEMFLEKCVVVVGIVLTAVSPSRLRSPRHQLH